MVQYIEKAAIVEEINRRILNYRDFLLKENPGVSELVAKSSLSAHESILRFIDSLEAKDVDLKKEIERWYDESAGNYRFDWDRFAKHFFNLGHYSQLTWQDIRLISEIGEDFMNSEESDNLGEEEYYTMILNKLKEKGRDYKTERQITRELEQKGSKI